MTWRTGFGLVLGLAGALRLSAEAPSRWKEGSLDARLIQAGYIQDLKTGRWEAEVEVRFNNHSLDRRFSRAVQVQFLDPQTKVLGTWKTFLSLPPGQAQHRRVRAPNHLGCAGPLTACAGLSLRLVLKPGKPLEPAVLIPAVSLEDAASPPVGVPLFVSRVLDGSSFQLLDGKRVRLLGLKDGGAEAATLLRERVMDATVSLAFDGEHRDGSGRWLVLVKLEDGSLLNQELLQKGLALVDPGCAPSRKEEFQKYEDEARAAKRGLWGKAKR